MEAEDIMSRIDTRITPEASFEDYRLPGSRPSDSFFKSGWAMHQWRKFTILQDLILEVGFSSKILPSGNLAELLNMAHVVVLPTY